MLFPVSGVEVSWWVPPLVAFCIAFFGAMGGVSGAFLLLPFQMSVLGFTAPGVSPTNLIYNMAGSPAAIWRYMKEGRMFWGLSLVILIGQLPGLFLGIFLRLKFLPNPHMFKLFVAVVLLYLGQQLVRSAMKKDPPQKGHEDVPGWGTVQHPRISLSEVTCQFEGETYSFRTVPILIVCCVVGVISGCYGIGGAAIMAPLFVAVCGLPVYIVAGSSLLANFAASTVGVLTYQFLVPLFVERGSVTPDWKLGLLFGAGGVVGMYFGARNQKYVPARWIKIMLAGAALFISLDYFKDIIFVR